MSEFALIAVADRDATEIGALYQKSRHSIINSVRYAVEAGQKLTVKKQSLAHGEWLPWLDTNSDALGFESRRTASRLMDLAAKWDASVPFDEVKAIEFNRRLWGHDELKDSQLIQQSISVEHYTPAQYIEAARAVLTAIDLDPASCAAANRVVKAKNFFDEKSDGLAHEWKGRVWLNPPYGDLPGFFIAKLCEEYASGNVIAAIALVNAHCTDTVWFRPLWDGHLCFTDHRINFSGDDARSGSTHGSVFIYFGKNPSLFAETFAQFGTVVARVR